MADPYRVWLSEVMLQQTTIAHARPYFEAFAARWPTVAALADADDGEVMAAWAGLGYYARARNLLACARTVVADHGGRFPDDEAHLLTLPGIGAYTAAAVAAIAFGRRAVAVDANVERVVARLFAVAEPLPGARPRLKALADRLTPARGVGDFIQAMMELGQTICLPRTPDCARCPIAGFCEGRREGDPGRYPVKAPKAARPQRTGTAYWLERDGNVLLVRRPAKGLLGGMLALPTETPPAIARWQEAGSVGHVFTHFSLEMKLLCGEADRPVEGLWWPISAIEEAGLPTLFAKLAARGTAWRQHRPSGLRGGDGVEAASGRGATKSHTPLPVSTTSGARIMGAKN